MTQQYTKEKPMNKKIQKMNPALIVILYVSVSLTVTFNCVSLPNCYF